MARTLRSTLFIAYLVFHSDLRAQPHRGFEVCYMAWPNTVLHQLRQSGRPWLDALIEDYHVTAIYLQIPWSFVETGPGRYTFGATHSSGMSINIDDAVKAILTRDLRLYVRVQLGSLPGDNVLGHPSLSDDLRLDLSENTSDFYHHKLGIARYPRSSEKLVSFLSPRGHKRLVAVYKATVLHMKGLAEEIGRLGQLVEINPSLSWHSETEYPWQYFVDYSDSAQARFREYLKTKYSIDSDGSGFGRLLRDWGDPHTATIPSSLKDIEVRNYNWSDVVNTLGITDPTGYQGVIAKRYDEYDFPGGRVDWVEFRTSALAGFIKDLADINHREGVSCAVQIGSAFDHLIEKRGWYDINPLLEHVDGIRTANIAPRRATFSFEADLMRTVCKFWMNQTGRTYSFSTETNWPGYENLDNRTLTETWSEQLKAFYNAGAGAHFVSGWGYWGKDRSGMRYEDYIEIYRDEYAAWRDTLGEYSGRPLQHPSPSRGVYLSTALGKLTHGYSSSTTPFADHCEYFIRLTVPESSLPVKQFYVPTLRRDIVTTYMVERDPGFVQQYITPQDTMIITDP